MPPRRRIERDDLTGRTGEIWRSYVNGESQTSIGKRLGLGQQRVSEILAEVRDTIPPEERTHLVVRESEFLDHLRRIALALVDRPPIPAYSNGKPIRMDDGTVAEDHSGRLAAWDRALKAHERLSRLLGLDAAAKVDTTVHTDPGDIELVQRIEAWKAAQEEAGGNGTSDNV